MSSPKVTKRNISLDAKAQSAEPSAAANTNNTDAPRDHAHAHHHHHHQRSHPHDHAGADGARRTSSASVDSDLTTWAHLSVDRAGATLRTVCTQDREDGEACQHSGHERRYTGIPHVDEPVTKISKAHVKAMEDGDGVETEEDEDGWVVLDRA